MLFMIGPFICMLPDMTYILGKKLFFKSPADSILQRMKHEQKEFGGSHKKSNKSKSVRKLPKSEIEFTKLDKVNNDNEAENTQIL